MRKKIISLTSNMVKIGCFFGQHNYELEHGTHTKFTLCSNSDDSLVLLLKWRREYNIVRNTALAAYIILTRE